MDFECNTNNSWFPKNFKYLNDWFAQYYHTLVTAGIGQTLLSLLKECAIFLIDFSDCAKKQFSHGSEDAWSYFLSYANTNEDSFLNIVCPILYNTLNLNRNYNAEFPLKILLLALKELIILMRSPKYISERPKV